MPQNQRFAEKGSLLRPQKSTFCFQKKRKKRRGGGSFICVKKSVDRGSFLFWRTIIRPPSCV